MITKYRTSWGIEITTVDVQRESDHSVWIDGRATKKHSNYAQYHPSWQEAYDYLHGKYKDKLDTAERQLAHAKNNYELVLNLDNL